MFDKLINGNIYYQAASERSAKLERVFIRVPLGTGSYSYQGDLNKNGIADESEYILDPYDGEYIQTTLPTDELFPVIDLKINTRWRIEFDEYFKQTNWISTALNAISTETTYRVEENSKIIDTKKYIFLT
ncbi:MAG: hypothetical protein H6613_19140 [Ignavibacteriales bacterium]|nr:hypothetical protein [Ignavibacteriales bacterium]